MAKRYIDAVEAEARIKELFPDMPKIDFMDTVRNWREKNKQYLQCLGVIRSLPTADVVDKERYDRLLENATIISEALNKYQSADMVEVVRCKDCKHWMDIDNGRQRHEMCAQLMPKWFCADGERKETEDEEK